MRKVVIEPATPPARAKEEVRRIPRQTPWDCAKMYPPPMVRADSGTQMMQKSMATPQKTRGLCVFHVCVFVGEIRA